jgi:hypothetical protein
VQSIFQATPGLQATRHEGSGHLRHDNNHGDSLRPLLRALNNGHNHSDYTPAVYKILPLRFRPENLPRTRSCKPSQRENSLPRVQLPRPPLRQNRMQKDPAPRERSIRASILCGKPWLICAPLSIPYGRSGGWGASRPFPNPAIVCFDQILILCGSRVSHHSYHSTPDHTLLNHQSRSPTKGRCSETNIVRRKTHDVYDDVYDDVCHGT